MEKAIKDDKISDFRNLVNSNSSFVYNTYHNKNGKNQWNIICSCMDWITVSIRYLQHTPGFEENIDVRVMQMFSLISAIDLVSEAITQLHRVFINPRTLPFSGEKECFTNRLFDEDDNSYFKSIRASFGAHPVNLNHSDCKRFASWPYDDHMDNDELTVNLYSNKVGESDLVMVLNSNELFCFLLKRYDYLDVLSQAITKLFNDFKLNLTRQPIETKASYLEQLYILKNESEIRLNNDYYNDVIDNLIMVYEAEPLEPDLEIKAANYRRSLKLLIDEIKINLQLMNIIDLDNDGLLEPKSDLSRKLSYELGKFYSWLHESRYDPLANYYLKRFNEETDYIYDFKIEDPVNTLFIKAKIMLLD
tara:strand:+ start:5470 stop:6555 length:1086 start_codon:yes stop_codon:yes gene_type:complete